MRRVGAIAWAGAAGVLLVLLIILVVIVRSNADASAPTARAIETAPSPPPPSTPQQMPAPRSASTPPVGLGPLPPPPAGANRPGPAPTPEVEYKLDDEEEAARTILQYDTSDFGKVVETLEDGTEIRRVRGAPVTDAEQERLRQEVTKMASAYETAYDQALAGGTQPDFARAVHAAREEFDKNVRELYHLTDQQFFELFPHRRNGAPRRAQ